MDFPPNCKFAMLAVQNARADVAADLRLQDGTRVLTGLPFPLDQAWRIWLGAMQSSNLENCNLFVVSLATGGWPEGQLAIFGGEVDVRLMADVGGIFAFLRLVGSIEYTSAFLLAGHFENGQPTCRHFANTEHFNRTSGCFPWAVGQADLELAARLHRTYTGLLKRFPERWRFGRGCNALKSAYERHYASDRMHGFVCALEALVLPEIGKTERQFISRCALLAGPKSKEPEIRRVLQEVYRMRCDVEHMHDWDRSLIAYPVSEREDIAHWRTRQMEELASAAYRKIISDAALHSHFYDDAATARLWKKKDDDLRREFGEICDISNLKIVKKYDSYRRAHPEEWPPELFEELRRMAKSA